MSAIRSALYAVDPSFLLFLILSCVINTQMACFCFWASAAYTPTASIKFVGYSSGIELKLLKPTMGMNSQLFIFALCLESCLNIAKNTLDLWDR